MHIYIYIYIYIYFGSRPTAQPAVGPAGQTVTFCLNLQSVPRLAWFCIAFSWQTGVALDIRWAQMGPIVGHCFDACNASIVNNATCR